MNNDVIFCIASLALLGWVIYLKLDVAKLKEEIEQLTRRLKRFLHEHGKDVETSDQGAAWGKRPRWMK